MSIILCRGFRPARSWLVIASILIITPLSTAPAAAENDVGQFLQHRPERLKIVVDVAEDFALFTPTLVKPTDTQPERGTFFVTEGNIYPAGTIEGDGAAFDPNSAGAIGRWFCRGTLLVPASAIPAAAFWVDTAQLYFLPDDTRSIATEGLEGAGVIVRTVTGGTGPLRGYLGEQRQEFLGFNASGGANLRVTFVLRKATR